MIAAKLIMTFCCIDSFRAYNQLESKFSSNQHNAALHLYASQRVQHTQSIGPIILYKDHSLHCRATTNSNFRSSSCSNDNRLGIKFGSNMSQNVLECDLDVLFYQRITILPWFIRLFDLFFFTPKLMEKFRKCGSGTL